MISQETVGEYTADVHHLSDLILISRKRWEKKKQHSLHRILYDDEFVTYIRREHLTPEQIKKWDELSKKVESGDITEELTKVSLNPTCN